MRGGGAGSSYNNPSGNYSQDGQDPPIDDVQGNLNGSNTPPSTWQYPFVVPKLEPIDEDRNDSGINSGSSDFHSSSPGSDTSQDLSIRTHTSQIYNNQAPIYYSPIAPKTVNSPPIMYSQPGSIPPHFTFNGHPLSPPNSEPMVSPNTPSIELPSTSTGISHNTTLTPCTSPSSGNSSPASSSDLCYPDPLSGLQNVVDRNALSPSDITPQLNNCSLSDDQKTCSEMARYDATAVPKINSHGKVKTYRCKQCNFVAITKRDYWTHAKSHMDPNKIMPCPRCDFVTEFKHHLEYHLHNHDGSKPFKCDQCNYSCVNKSMLNSHLKSHSNIYQYRCANCTYATKYCHSLKLHLRKYEHKPAMVLNPDGTPNPLPIIDVYGSRRGPKMKPQLKTQQQQLQPQPSTSCSAQARNEQQPETNPQQVLPFHLNQLMTCVSPQLPLPFSIPFFAGFPGGIPNPILMQQFERIVAEVQAAKALSAENEENQPMEVIPSAPQEPQSEVLDLSISPENNQNGKNRRKGVAVKLPPPESSEDEDDDDETTTMFSNVEVVNSNEDGKCEEYSNNNKENNFCQYCNINFGDGVLYSIHMGYHGLQDPFTCNMCGVECGDKVAFFLHVARTQHH